MENLVIFDGNLFLNSSKFITIMDCINFIQDKLNFYQGFGTVVWQDLRIKRTGYLNPIDRLGCKEIETKIGLNFIADFLTVVGMPQVLFPEQLTSESVNLLLNSEFLTRFFKQKIIITEDREFWKFAGDNVVIDFNNKLMTSRDILNEIGFTPEELKNGQEPLYSQLDLEDIFINTVINENRLKNEFLTACLTFDNNFWWEYVDKSKDKRRMIRSEFYKTCNKCGKGVRQDFFDPSADIFLLFNRPVGLNFNNSIISFLQEELKDYKISFLLVSLCDFYLPTLNSNCLSRFLADFSDIKNGGQKVIIIMDDRIFKILLHEDLFVTKNYVVFHLDNSLNELLQFIKKRVSTK